MTNIGDIPRPAPNGGLYTGLPFESGAEYANVYVRPSWAYMNSVNLRSADPPPGALEQMPAHNRPGNNDDDVIPGARAMRPTGTLCAAPPRRQRPPPPSTRVCAAVAFTTIP